MIEESKYCSDAMKKHYDKRLVMKKEDNEDLKNSTKGWIYYNGYIDTDDKVRDNCHITGKIEASLVDIVISILNSILKFLSYFTT